MVYIFNIISYQISRGTKYTRVCIQIENTILIYLWKCKNIVITKIVLKKSNIR